MTESKTLKDFLFWLQVMDKGCKNLWGLYDRKSQDTEQISFYFNLWLLGRSKVLESPLNQCGHRLDDELITWLYEMKVIGYYDRG